MFTKKKIKKIKIIVYIFITVTSFESWMIYVIYFAILIGFSPCKLESQRIKFWVRHFGQFLSDVNIDVNGNLPFLKFPLNLIVVFEKTDIRYLSVIYFGHASFAFPIITEHQYSRLSLSQSPRDSLKYSLVQNDRKCTRCVKSP